MTKDSNAALIINDPKFSLAKDLAKPEFMVIGAAKCGTTSLSSYLPLHPQIKICDPKEPNYWSWQLCNMAQYQSLFVNTPPVSSPNADQRIGGEYSTSSLLHPLVPRRVRAHLPALKIIVLLRNPVERAYSHFIMSQRQGFEPIRSFDDIVRKEIEEVPALLEAHKRGFLDLNAQTNAHRSAENGNTLFVSEHNESWTKHPLSTEQNLFRFYFCSYVFRSIYYDQIWRWLQLFDRKQIKIIESTSLMDNRQETMNEVVNFLGLPAHNFNAEELAHTWGGGASNFKKPGDYAEMNSDTRTLLNEFFSPHNEKLFDLIGQRFNWT